MNRPASHIRPATPGDTDALAALMTQLGYPTDADGMRARMARMASPEHATWVAEANGVVIGLVGAFVGLAYHQDAPYARILALIVDPARRGHGTGAALVRTAEEWARAQGAISIHLTTSVHRADAHRFYENVGYEATGKRFYKALV